jgi:tripartite-type tricarboxylate transporter receptor subunit TctC
LKTAPRTILAVVLACLAGIAAAQAPTAKPIRLVVPFGAGGGPDTLARILAHKLAEAFGQPAMVDNRPGSGGIVAAELVMKAAPDGTTLLVADSGHYAINPNLRAKLPYDPLRDFAPVIEAVDTHLFLTVGASLPARSVAEFVALSRSRPGGLHYGSSGSGSPHHLAMELLRLVSEANLIHVPYKGVAQSVPALLSGDVAALFAGPSSLLPHVRAGKLRMLAVASGRRATFAANVPTVAESGYPDYEMANTIGLLAPAGTPAESVRRLNEDLAKLIRLPDVGTRLAELGLDIIAGTPEQFSRSIQLQIEKYARLVKISGAKVD